MKHEFFQPRFVGPRFNEATLPLDVVQDLIAYQSLVIDLAKHLYLQDHSERQRVPKGFAADFQLHLEKIEAGSARPMLCLMAAASSLFAPGADGNVYFERSRDLITDCIRAPEGKLPEAFPKELLHYFNQLGRSLRDDEKLEIPGRQGHVGTLTQKRRKDLVLAGEKVYERVIDLLGTIGEADWEKSSFRLRLSDNSSTIIPMPQHFHPKARKYGGNGRVQINVKGIGSFDSWDRLQKVLQVESLEVQENFQLAARFENLLQLADGWLEGGGVAPAKAGLQHVADRFVESFPETLGLPAIAPTPEGNLLLEWNVPGYPSVDLDLGLMKAQYHALDSDGAEIEEEFLLSEPQQWSDFFKFLGEALERPSI